MRKMISKSILRILFGVLCLIFFTGLPNIANAGDITVDESDIRGPGEFKGPLPIMITAFAEGLPGPILGDRYFYTLFDTGSTSVAIDPLLKAHLGLSSSLPKTLLVRINGMGTIDENTLSAPIGPPIAGDPQTQQYVIVGSTTLNWTLIGAPVANDKVAYIDNRVASRITRGPDYLYDDPYFTGPDISFFTQNSVPTLESMGKKKELTLRLEPFGETGSTNEGATKGQRYYLRDVVFNDGGNQLSDLSDLGGGVKVQNLDLLWDTGAPYTAISPGMALSLMLSQQAEFICDVSPQVQLKGYVIDSVVMNGVGGGWEGNYTVQNVRICVDDRPDAFGGVADARIGSNLFEQVPILFHGPGEYLQILSDFELKQGDFDDNGVVDCDDYDLLMAEINRPTESINIVGNTRIQRPFGESGLFFHHTISVNYTSDPRVHITSITYDFTGGPVIYEPLGANTQVFDFPDDDGIIYSGEGYSFINFSPNVNGNESDYIGGKVKIVLTDGTEFETTFTNVLTSPNSSGVEAVFNQNIDDFLPPADLTFDLNDDGIVDQADVDMLIVLFDNPGDLPCSGGGVAEADLMVTKSDNLDPVEVGEQLTYTIAVTNNGPDQATGVQAIDTLPGTANFVSATPSQGSCTQSTGVVTCDLGTLNSGATATITIVVEPTAVGTITNTANVSGTEQDPVSANNSSTETTEVKVILVGDLDGDGDVDRDDINIIGSHRNQPVSVCPECDIDGDGMITILDARKLVLMCTCPRCLCP